MEYKAKNGTNETKENSLTYSLKQTLSMAKTKGKKTLDSVMDSGGMILLGGILATAMIILSPFYLYANYKVKKTFREKYGINISDLNDDDHEALLFMNIMERKDSRLTPEFDGLRKQIVKNHQTLEN